ncbi:MMPL family transporter [Noviherbaspirillum pedocola]|uniref:MMPL family transporter n=1 Tax=Noviherbaspirillum pedocola TaxID=2801341 RepID=A0A934STW5_9BURK|nr:MMPL family transporter [Noviherbaspirillum pedocola]MBK4736696.1 MMPL family transporter [Noviherbaspirillum pedocola]
MIGPLRSARGRALALWLTFVLLCAGVIHGTRFSADLSAFLPQSPTAEQRVLLDQLRDGVVARLILVGIEGGDAGARAALSKAMAARLRADAGFAAINNGEPINAERDQRFLFENRYLLSPAVEPERFRADGLREALSATIDLLASPAGMLVKPLLPRDPTGETVALLEAMASNNRPRSADGVWVSRDGKTALLLAQTRAAGADTDGQAQAMRKVEDAFAAARASVPGASALRLEMTGPGVFSVRSRDTIESEATRLSIIGSCIIIAMLLILYRSPVALALGLLPVVSGALAGVTAVSLGFGVVHGITLGFGTTLIGEAVDYSIYLFVQSRALADGGADAKRGWIREFWPTVRLGVAISIVGFASLLLSTFPGLAQLGLYSIAGLVTAALATRFILPYLLPKNFRVRDVAPLGRRLASLAQRAPLLRLPLGLLLIAAVALVWQHRHGLWNTELASLSPVPQAEQDLDARLRANLGAPDVRYLVSVSADSREAALIASERIAHQLDALVSRGLLSGYESASRYLPSLAAQRARQASLPATGLDDALRQAASDLPVRASLFAPFLEDVEASRTKPLLTRADLDGTSFAQAVDSLMFERDGRWSALLPLSASAQGGALPVDAVRAALDAAGEPGAVFVDMKTESDRIYAGYLRQALLLSAGGVVAIVALLLLALRSPRRVLLLLLPLSASVISIVAILTACGVRMTVLHLVGLLLIVAVGSNYALFFDNAGKAKAGGPAPETLASLMFANLSTVAGFGVLGFSQVPVLQAIGATVGPGAVLALVYAAVFVGGKR